MERLLYEVKKVIVGQDHLLERLIVALLARGHILVEGVPGLAKTMAIKTLADTIGGEFKRIQFTPDLVPATIGNPGAVRQGSEAYALGSPFGLYGSVSAGVISGLDRSFKMQDTGRTLTGLFQIDAAVNPGNSGGALVDRSGRVIGIVTALINPTDDDVFIGIGLAVPIDVAGGAAGLLPY